MGIVPGSLNSVETSGYLRRKRARWGRRTFRVADQDRSSLRRGQPSSGRTQAATSSSAAAQSEEWPTSPNPHLLISTHGAHAENIPPLAVRTIALVFRGLQL
nr:hypothetical protein JVH1_1163 [Rhodococcus sp. JVH1]